MRVIYSYKQLDKKYYINRAEPSIISSSNTTSSNFKLSWAENSLDQAMPTIQQTIYLKLSIFLGAKLTSINSNQTKSNAKYVLYIYRGVNKRV